MVFTVSVSYIPGFVVHTKTEMSNEKQLYERDGIWER